MKKDRSDLSWKYPKHPDTQSKIQETSTRGIVITKDSRTGKDHVFLCNDFEGEIRAK